MDTIIAIEATFTASKYSKGLRISHFFTKGFNNATNTNEVKISPALKLPLMKRR
jgi:hypothetical protein